MTSEMAVEDIEQMQADGLKPTVKDIIRLNALALKYERAKSKNISDSVYMLPRVAFLDEKTYFRQPTIGHEIWLDQVEHVIDRKDYQTVFAVHSYALSRNEDELCDPLSKSEVTAAVQKFLPTLSSFTEDQVFAALNYAQNDLRSEANEYPSPAQEEEKDDEDEEDWDTCVALGTLREAQAILYGITIAEAKKMTRQHLNDVVRRAYMINGIKLEKSGDYELGCYYRTLDDIRKRLENEKKESEVK